MYLYVLSMGDTTLCPECLLVQAPFNSPKEQGGSGSCL